ncbi:putative Peptidase M48, Ste24p [uncultured Desulfobacterium sp.]|uniref:Putative Peptidase M48, Ste24p n=1 Tax=uncultured Desulfobacterium sp. TaxID=201089 RepID=A0A445MW04_9BACT|nr:putative Peptidase M48, Ste24p [uncultured Desulfobacterium sp.]
MLSGRSPIFNTFRFPSAALVFCALLIFGCATNPATRKMELMLVSEDKEFEIGQSVDKKVREEMGLYLEQPQLRSYVKQMGEAIGRQSDRPGLIYRIEIVDTPDFNAFAVPGGFVYVHRGLLERMNSADELASVLGHEIAHVAARHSAAQISKAQLLNIGLIGVNIATGGALQDFGQLVNLGSVLAFSKFSRDDEREADYFGTKYITSAGYNPNGAINMMEQLKKLNERKPSSMEVWFMTHPPTDERINELSYQTKDMGMNQPQVLDRPIRRNEFIALLDGMAVGEYNGKEMVKGDRYYNKEYLFSLEIPQGFMSQINSKNYTAVFADPKKGMEVYLGIEPLQKIKTTTEFFSDFEKRLEKAGLKKKTGIDGSRNLSNGALSSILSGYDSRAGSVMAEAIAFVKETNGFSMIGLSKEDNFKNFQPVMEAMANSISFISQEKANTLGPSRLKVHKVERGETWEDITKRYFSSPDQKDRLAEYNGYKVSQDPEPGTLIKIPPSLRVI